MGSRAVRVVFAWVTGGVLAESERRAPPGDAAPALAKGALAGATAGNDCRPDVDAVLRAPSLLIAGSANERLLDLIGKRSAPTTAEGKFSKVSLCYIVRSFPQRRKGAKRFFIGPDSSLRLCAFAGETYLS